MTVTVGNQNNNITGNRSWVSKWSATFLLNSHLHFSTGLFIITAILLTPFSLRAQQSGGNKAEVDPGNTRISLTIPFYQKRNSLTMFIIDSVYKDHSKIFRKVMKIKIDRSSLKTDSLTFQITDTVLIESNQGMMGILQLQKHSRPFNSKNFFEKFRSRSTTFKPPPVRIQTRAIKGNRVAVFIENRTDEPIKNLTVTVDQLPEEWSVSSPKEKINFILPGRQKQFTFLFKGGKLPRRVGFKFEGADTLFIYWSARIRLAVKQKALVSRQFKVFHNYPNPFSVSTTISYTLPSRMKVRIVIYNVLGQRVAVPVNEIQKPGTHNITWEATGLASGVYLCRITAETESGKNISGSLR